MNDWAGKPRRQLTPFGDLVDGVIGDVLRRAGATAHHEIWTRWADIAGKAWETSTPMRIDEGTLWIAVPDAGSATRLRYSTTDLINRIAARVGEGEVTAVRLKVSREKTPS